MQRGAVVFPEVRACLRVRRGKAGGNRYFLSTCVSAFEPCLKSMPGRRVGRTYVSVLNVRAPALACPRGVKTLCYQAFWQAYQRKETLFFDFLMCCRRCTFFLYCECRQNFSAHILKRTPRFARFSLVGLFAEVYGIFGKTPDVGEVSVEAHVVESVADEVFFVDVEAVEVGIDVDSAVVEFVDEHGGFNAFGGKLRFEHVEQVVCGVAGIDDIVDQQDVLVVYVGQVADDFDVAFCVEFVAVARDFDKLKLDGRFEASYQVGAKEHAAFEHANNVERFVGGEKVFDFRRDFAGFFANLFLRIQNSQIRVLTVGYVKKFFFVQSSYSVIISSAWVAFWSETRSFSLIPTPAAHKTSLPEHKSKIPSRW